MLSGTYKALCHFQRHGRIICAHNSHRRGDDDRYLATRLWYRPARIIITSAVVHKGTLIELITSDTRCETICVPYRRSISTHQHLKTLHSHPRLRGKEGQLTFARPRRSCDRVKEPPSLLGCFLAASLRNSTRSPSSPALCYI